MTRGGEKQMEEKNMKRIKLFIFNLFPTSIPELVKSVNEKKFPSITYIGSITETKEGKLICEGATEELKDWIEKEVKEYQGKTLLIRGGGKISVEDDVVIYIGALVPIKPDLPCWFEALAEVMKRTKLPTGEEVYTEVEYLDEAQEKEAEEAFHRVFGRLNKRLTWPEFIERFPQEWEDFKKSNPELVERVKKKYPELEDEVEKSK